MLVKMASPVLVASSMTRHIPAPFHPRQHLNGPASTLAAHISGGGGGDGNSRTGDDEHDALSQQGGDLLLTARSSSSTSPALLSCPFEGCDRTFAKACKLEEHQRIHTGERPFQCTHPGCSKDFRRKDHLQRHAKSHQTKGNATEDSAENEFARPFQCRVTLAGNAGMCGKRFMTRQHLERHVCEVHEMDNSSCDEVLTMASRGGDRAAATDVDEEPKTRLRKRTRRPGTYKCSIADCTATFTKRKLLRAHINFLHSDKGRDLHMLDADEAATVARLPFPCTEAGCEKRFPTNAKRTAHVEQRHNQQMRYVCTYDHDECDSTVQFATWTELQAHHRAAHKPTCPVAGCEKVFKESRNLRLHLQRCHTFDADAWGDDGNVEDDQGALSFPNTAEATTQWPCNWVDAHDDARCTQIFSTKYNRDVHVRTVHRGERRFVCPHSSCSRRFTSKRASVRHGHKCGHSVDRYDGKASADLTSDEEDNDEFYREEGGAVPESAADRPRVRKRAHEHSSTTTMSALDMLTGHSYANGNPTKKRKVRGRVLGCPWPRICALRETRVDEDDSSTSTACPYRFSRVYDVQRHLQRKHDLTLSQLDIRALLDDGERAQLGTPRNGTRIATESQQVTTDDEEEEEEEEEF